MLKQCAACALLAASLVFMCASDTNKTEIVAAHSVGETEACSLMLADEAGNVMFALANGETYLTLDASEMKYEVLLSGPAKEIPEYKETEPASAETIKSDTKTDTSKSDTSKKDTIKADTIKKDTLQTTKKTPSPLTDEQFSLLLTEAEKYLGYKYVWGGSTPSTSFDCSGYVSWVVNHSGIGVSIGRKNAKNIYKLCTKISASELKPGDLVFFKGTYSTSGVSHVGIYIGNGKMIHCGTSVSYADLSIDYWKNHFYAYGRLPNE